MSLRQWGIGSNHARSVPPGGVQVVNLWDSWVFAEGGHVGIGPVLP
jgi:hypothetical protein